MRMKTGIVDVGGGLRGIYAAGVLDYCMDPNRIVPKIDPREFDLSQINDALQLVAGGHINGKVMIRFPE